MERDVKDCNDCMNRFYPTGAIHDGKICGKGNRATLCRGKNYCEWFKKMPESLLSEVPGQSAVQPEGIMNEYSLFFKLLNIAREETLRYASSEPSKVGCYDYDDAFFHKKFDQEKEEFLTAIRYGVEEDYEVKAASYIGYITGWCAKVIKEARNDKSS